jgi:hypothetical protein
MKTLRGRAERASIAAVLFLVLSAPALADARVILQPVVGSSPDQVIAFLDGIGAEVLTTVSTENGPFVIVHADEPHVGLLRQAPVVDPYFRIDAVCQGWTSPCTDAPVNVALRIEDTSVSAVMASLGLLGGEISRQEPPFYEARLPVDALSSFSEELESIEGASVSGVHELFMSGPGCCGPLLEEVAVGEGRRFAVRAWTLPVPPPPNGLELGVDSAGFHFFSAGNLEILVKVLDGCAVNGHWWVFAAGLTDQFVRIEIDDRVSGLLGNPASRSYESPRGRPFAPVIDLEAFLCES